MPSADAEVIDALERRAAFAADDRSAIAADQRTRDGQAALGAVVGGGFGRRRIGLRHPTIIIALSLAGCVRWQTQEPSIGVAYVAPASLQLREEIAPRARVTATLAHGARVEILARRRRFAKVREAGGAAGWTDGRQLLSAEGMGIFRAESERAGRMPPQGSAKASESLNVHITPYRTAPSFHTLAEGERVEMVGRSIVPRIQYVPPGEASGQLVSEGTGRDDWTQVRLRNGRCGWVLSAMLDLELPDEVIQLAEGHRITAFFTLARTSGKDGREHPVYLWTTIDGLPEHRQFDSFRVFLWSATRERYESAHVERNVDGFHPVVVEQGAGVARVRLVYAPAPGEPAARHTFEFRDRKFRRVSQEPWQRPGELPPAEVTLPDGPEPPPGWWQRVQAWARTWRK